MRIKEFEKRFNEIEIKKDEHQNKRASLLQEFINKNGINKIKSKQLDKIISIYGYKIFWMNAPKITDIYDIVSSRESNNKMTGLTWGMFLFALITTLASIYSIFN